MAKKKRPLNSERRVKEMLRREPAKERGVLPPPSIQHKDKRRKTRSQEKVDLRRESASDELVKIALLLDDEVEDYEFRRRDSKLNVLAQKMADGTDGDIEKMSTVIVMALRKAGYESEANQIYMMFRQFLKKVQRKFEL